jgi:hypothetical protein
MPSRHQEHISVMRKGHCEKAAFHQGEGQGVMARILVSRILLETCSNFVYFALRSRLFPGNIATRLSPWHILSSYCLSTCSYLTRRYTMRYLILLLLFLTILDLYRWRTIGVLTVGPHGSVLAPDGVAYLTLPYIYCT